MPSPHAGPGRDAPGSQPALDVPWPIAATLAVLVAVQAGRALLPERWDDALFLRLAFVPGRETYAFAPAWVTDALAASAAQGGLALKRAQAEGWILSNTGPDVWTVATYALLHADWAHLGVNALLLFAAGTPVARRLGAPRFFAFLLAGAVAGALVQWACQPLELAPVLGASAAVSGCLGATLRFMLPPGPARGRAASAPLRGLGELSTDGRALTLAVAWVAVNLLLGLAPAWVGGDLGIAWQAHVGAFALGLLLFGLFDPAPAPAVRGATPGVS